MTDLNKKVNQENIQTQEIKVVYRSNCANRENQSRSYQRNYCKECVNGRMPVTFQRILDCEKYVPIK